MRQLTGKIFPILLAALTLLLVSIPALAHPSPNGTWVLVPTRSNFAGEPVLQTGTVQINERQHHMYISRSFNYDGESGGFASNFTTDGQENSTIRKGQTFKSKAGWDGNVLKVKTTRDGLTTIERYTLAPDGTMVLTIERPDHQLQTLVFQRQ
jgi:hypothetical protein